MTKWQLAAPLTLMIAGTVAAPVELQAAQGQPPALQQTVDDLRRQLDEERATNARQAAQLEAIAKELAALRARLDAGPTPPAAAPSPPPSPAPQTEARLEAIEQTLKRLPELPAHIVSAGDFPGSVEIPGTDSAFKFGGQLRATFIHTMGPLGTDDRFIASSIPVGDEQLGDTARTEYTAAPSRLNFDLRSSALGGLRSFIEGDFAGSSNAFRLRHAFIQSRRWLFGQTWSTFSDPDVQPVDIDFEGENALSRFRQTQVRWTRTIDTHLELSLAAENPAPDLSGAEGVNLTPDFVGRIRWEPRDTHRGLVAEPQHFQAAVLVRTLRGALVDLPDERVSTVGFGGTVSGIVVPLWDADDRVKFAVYGGWGIGRYITDLNAEGGQDAVYDATTNGLRTLPVTAAYAAYEHRWARKFLSAATYGVVYVSNLDIQSTSALRRTQRVTANVTWNPITRADFVVEFLAGERVNKDGESGRSTQVQTGWRVRF